MEKINKKKDSLKIDALNDNIIEAAPEVNAPIEDIKNEVTELTQSFIEEKTEKKQKRKSKYMEKKEQMQEQSAAFGQALSTAFTNVLDIVIQRMPNPIPLSDNEKSMLTVSAQAVAEKYQDRIGDFSEELALGVSLFVVFLPRYKKPEPDKEETKGVS